MSRENFTFFEKISAFDVSCIFCLNPPVRKHLTGGRGSIHFSGGNDIHTGSCCIFQQHISNVNRS